MTNREFHARKISGDFKWSLLLIGFIACFCLLGVCIRPSADDYEIYTILREKGFWPSQIFHYTTINGRWANIFLLLTASQINGALLPWLTAASSLCFLYVLISEAANSMSVSAKVKAALCFQAAWLASVPALNETFYWLSGMPYTWAAALSLLCLAGLIHVLRVKKRGAVFYLLCLCVFVNGMNLEPTCVTQTAVLFFLACYYSFNKNPESALTAGVLLLAAAGAFSAMYLAPGTTARMLSGGALPPLSARLFRTFAVAAVFGGITAAKFFMKPVIYVFLLFLPDISAHAAPFDQKISSRLKAWHIFALAALIAPFQQAIAGWAMGIGLPPRAEGLAIWIMGASWTGLWAFGYRNEAVLKRIRSSRLYKRRGILLILCLVLSGNFISLVRDLPLARSYAAQMEAREASVARQKSEGKEDILVPSLTVKPRLLFFSDIRPSPDDWKNQSFAAYHGVRSVSAMPEKMLDDERAIRGFREGSLAGLTALAEAGDPEVQFMLGEIYDTTFAAYRDVPKDNAAAAKWYRMAAAQGYSHACRRLTRFYALGMGVPKNYFYAAGWLIRSQF